MERTRSPLKILNYLSKKDDIVNIFDSVRTVLKSKNPRRIKDAMRVDAEPSFILELVTENIPREYEKVKKSRMLMKWYLLADIYLGRAFNTRMYTYWKYSYELNESGCCTLKGRDLQEIFKVYKLFNLFYAL